MNKSDKRRFKRYDSNQALTVIIATKEGAVVYQGSGTAVNISKTGILIHTHRYIIPGTKLDITFDVSQKSIHLKGKCMFCRKSDSADYEAGIHIHKISKEAVELYLSFINTHEDNMHDDTDPPLPDHDTNTSEEIGHKQNNSKTISG